MKRTLLLVAAVSLLAVAAVAQDTAGLVTTAATTHAITVKIQGIGCSSVLRTADTFDVSSWTFGAALAVASSSGGGTSAGKATVSDLLLQKLFDACSPKLFEAVVTGKHFLNATLTEEGQLPDGRTSPLLVLTLTDVIADSYRLSGSETGGQPTETLTLNYRKICVQEMASSSTTMCYDKAHP